MTKIFNQKVFDPTRDYICVYDFDSIIFAGVSILQKDFIYAIHKETDTEKKFDNISKFRGVGVDSRPDGIGGQFIELIGMQQFRGSPLVIDIGFRRFGDTVCIVPAHVETACILTQRKTFSGRELVNPGIGLHPDIQRFFSRL